MDEFLLSLKNNQAERQKIVGEQASSRFESWLWERYNQEEIYGCQEESADYESLFGQLDEEDPEWNKFIQQIDTNYQNNVVDIYMEETEEDKIWFELLEEEERLFRKMIVEFFESKKFSIANIVDFFFNFNNDKINDYDSNIKSKILVIGKSDVRKKDLLGIIKHYGLHEDRFEFVLEYESAKNYNFNKLRHNEKYQAIMIGPIPHKIKGVDSNLISMLEKNEEFPTTIRLINSNDELKISKSTFSKTLEIILQDKILSV